MRLETVRSLPSPGHHLCGLAWDGDSLWHSDGTTNTIYKIDPITGNIIHEFPCDLVRTCLDFDGENLWQIAGKPKRIRIVRPTDGVSQGEINFESDTESVCALHVGQDRYWLGSKTTGIIEERDRIQQHVLSQWNTQGSVHGLALVNGILWYTDYPASCLVGFDSVGDTEVARFTLPGS